MLNYLEFGPMNQEMLFKDISYLELWPFVRQSGIICAILVECIMRLNSVKLL